MTATSENNVAAQAGDEPMPCPFCGGRAKVQGIYRLSGASYFVACLSCQARQESVEAWNRRVSPRATADVERDSVLEEAARLCDVKYKARAEFGLVREAASARALGEEIRALKSVATTKPGA